MKRLLLIKKEISLLHLLMLLTSKLFIGISIGLFFSDLAFPWNYPLLIIGLAIFLPALYYLFRKGENAEKSLKKELVKKKVRKKR